MGGSEGCDNSVQEHTLSLSLSQTPHCRQWVKSGGKRKGSERERKGKRKGREREGKEREGKGKDKGKGGENAKGQRVLERRKQKLWKTKENRVREKEKAENKRKQPMVQKSTVCVELSIAQSLALSTEPRTAQSTQIPNDPCQQREHRLAFLLCVCSDCCVRRVEWTNEIGEKRDVVKVRMYSPEESSRETIEGGS